MKTQTFIEFFETFKYPGDKLRCKGISILRKIVGVAFNDGVKKSFILTNTYEYFPSIIKYRGETTKLEEELKLGIKAYYSSIGCIWEDYVDCGRLKRCILENRLFDDVFFSNEAEEIINDLIIRTIQSRIRLPEDIRCIFMNILRYHLEDFPPSYRVKKTNVEDIYFLYGLVYECEFLQRQDNTFLQKKEKYKELFEKNDLREL